MDEGPQPHEQTAEDRPETVGDLLLKRLGIDPNRWTIGDRRLALLGIGIGLTILIIAVCGYVFGWEWTGLAKRTFWDWLSLLIVPLVLALGGYFFTRSENQRTREAADEQRALDRQIADEQRSLDREIADARRQDDTLQAYLDGMAQLLTDKDPPLHRAQVGDSLSTVARARTLTVLARLDGQRKRSVVQFLYESGLISADRPVLDLSGADLSGADLRVANLRGANLRGADLSGADLSEATLSEANLHMANLFRTDLSEADLRMADLSEANLRMAALSGANLHMAIVNGANLHIAIVYRANLRMANLFRANLRGADLVRANLFRADLSEADLSGANLRMADLRGADLSGADLSEATLSEAGLIKADLSEAKLVDAQGWTDEQLELAASLKGATMPNGQKYEDWLKDREGRKQNE